MSPKTNTAKTAKSAGNKKTIRAGAEPQLHVLVFGKAGCDKCAILEKRLDQMLGKEEYSQFDKVKFDMESEEGLVEFCSLECMNPQRIPGFVVARRNQRSQLFEPLPRRPDLAAAGSDDLYGDARLHTWLGLQTDYSPQGGGVISPKMIAAVLREAKAWAAETHD